MMKVETLCRRIRTNDVSLKEVDLENYDAPKIERVLQALREGRQSNGNVEKLVLRHCQLSVETFTSLLIQLCNRHDGQTVNHNTTSSPSSFLKSLTLCLHEVGFNIPADEIAFRLFRGITLDKPAGLADLQNLKMCTSGLSERSMRALQRLLRKPTTVLEKLDMMNGRWVDDDTVEKISHSLTCNASGTKLLYLILCGNQIGNAGAQHLASMLKNNTILKELHLDVNEIGDEGAIALANVLTTHNRTLFLLDLETNQIGDAGVMALARAVMVNSTLAYLSLQRNPPVTHVGEHFLVDSVAQMHGLKGLDFGPVRKMGHLMRLATAMESNHSLCEITYVFREDTFLEPEEDLKPLPWHQQPDIFTFLSFQFNMGAEYATIKIPDVKIEIMAKYIPYIKFLCGMNEMLRPLIFQPKDQAPHGLWPHVMEYRAPDCNFWILRQWPEIFGNAGRT
jgi:hypothetical protein